MADQLKVIRYFTAEGNSPEGWYFTQDDDINTRNGTVLTGGPNLDGAHRIILDADTPAGSVSGGDDNDEFLISPDITGETADSRITITDLEGTNTVIFGKPIKTVVIDGSTTTTTTTSLAITSVTISTVAFIPNGVGRIEFERSIVTETDNGGGSTPTSTTATETVRLHIHQTTADNDTGGVTRFTYEDGELANRILSFEELKSYVEGGPIFTENAGSDAYAASVEEGSTPADAGVIIDVDAVSTASGADLDYFFLTGNLQKVQVGSDQGFVINQDTGEISLESNTLDFEAALSKTITLTVQVTDGTNTDTTEVQITITNKNEGPAKFEISGYTGAPVIGDDLTVARLATDGDDPDGNGPVEPSYSWFRVDADGVESRILDENDMAVTGSTYTVAMDDLDHTIRVYAAYTDGGGYPENVPIDTSFKVLATLPDNALISLVSADGKAVADLVAGDAIEVNVDVADPEGVQANSSSYTWFRVVDGGVETSITNTGDSYTLTADDISSDTQQVDIIVRWTYTDTANNAGSAEARINYVGTTPPELNTPPQITGSTLTATSFDEDDYTDEMIATVTATDNDAGDSVASFDLDQAAKDLGFAIDNSGVITFTGTLNYEAFAATSGAITLSVTATDSNGGVSVPSSVTVTVANVNEGATSFKFTSDRASDVNAADPRVGDTLTVATDVADPDGDDGVAYTYTWWRADDAAGTNAVQIMDQAGDDIVTAAYTLTGDDRDKFVYARVAEYSDEGGFTNTPADVVIPKAVVSAVTTATFEITGYIGGVPTVGEELTVSRLTSDPQGDGAADPTYTWYRVSNDAQRTETQIVDADNNAVTGTTYTVADADVGFLIRVRATYTDGASNPEDVPTTLDVTAEASPVSFGATPPTITSPIDADNAQTGDVVVSGISASGGTGKIEYSLENNHGRFQINPFRGDVSVSEDFGGGAGGIWDYETTPEYKLVIIATDVDDNSDPQNIVGGTGGTATITVTVPVTNADDGDATYRVDEDGAMLTVNLVTADPDGVKDGTQISYQWFTTDGTTKTDITDADEQTFDSSTHTLPSGSLFGVTVTYTDNVDDTAENVDAVQSPIRFTQDGNSITTYAVDVAEDRDTTPFITFSNIVSTVGLKTGGTFTYSYVTGTPNEISNLFQLSSTGVFVGGLLDYETLPNSYTATIIVSYDEEGDGSGAIYTRELDVVVTVTDVVDTATYTLSSDGDVAAPEAGDTLTIANSALDPDGTSGATATYAWYHVNDDGSETAITDDSGAVTGTTYELRASDIGETVRVIATYTNAANETINVRTDTAAEVVSDPDEVLTLNYLTSTSVPTVTAGNEGWYSVTGDASAGYALDTNNPDAIDPNSAVAHRFILGLRFPDNLALDGGGGDDEYLILPGAEGGSTESIDIVDVEGHNKIIIGDTITTTSYTISHTLTSVSTNADNYVLAFERITTVGSNPPGTSTMSVVVKQPTGPDNSVVFAFEAGELAGRTLTYAELEAYIGGAPIFTQSAYTAEVEEGVVPTDAGTIVTVAADDTNTDNTALRYSFVTPAPTGFSIDAMSGAITLDAALDYEIATSHTFEVEVTDGSKTDTATVTITVTDVHDTATFEFSSTNGGDVDAPAVGDKFVISQVEGGDDPQGNPAAGTIIYKWFYVDDAGVETPIVDGLNQQITGNPYTIQTADVGKTIRARAEYMDGAGNMDSVPTDLGDSVASTPTIHLASDVIEIAHDKTSGEVVLATINGDARFTADIIISYTLSDGTKVEYEAGSNDSPDSEPAYWFTFEPRYSSNTGEVSFDFGGGFAELLTNDLAGPAAPTPGGVEQEFTIDVMVGGSSVAEKTVTVRITGPEDSPDATNPFVDNTGTAIAVSDTISETDLEAGTETGVRTGTMFINDVDEGETYGLTVSYTYSPDSTTGSVTLEPVDPDTGHLIIEDPDNAGSFILADITTRAAILDNASNKIAADPALATQKKAVLTTTMGKIELTLDGKQIDWTYTYNQDAGALADSGTLTEQFTFTLSDAGATDPAPATPLIFALTAAPDANAAPVITVPDAIEIAEGSYTDEAVVDLEYTDVDNDTTATFMFVKDDAGTKTLVAEIDFGGGIIFKIAADGAITVSGDLNYEALPADAKSYTLTVRATDATNSNASDDVDIVVNIGNENEGATTFKYTDASDTTAPTVGETLEVEVATADPDGEPDSYTYTWYRAGANPADNIGTGASYTVQTADVGSEIGVRIATYTDDGGFSNVVADLARTGLVGAGPTINTPPRITTTDLTGSIDEGQHDAQLITTIAATDDEQSNLEFSLPGAPDGFNIDNSGAITFTGVLDHEGTPGGTITLTVSVTDNIADPVTEDVVVTINDISTNIGPAVFDISGYNDGVPRVGDTLAVAVATPDPDGDPDAGYTYTWYRTDGTTSTDLSASNTEGTEYTVTGDDVGFTIGVRVTEYTDKENNTNTAHAETFSTVAAVSTAAQISIISSSPGIEIHQLEASSQVKVDIGTDDPQGNANALADPVPATTIYTWYRVVDGVQDATAIAGATTASYTLTAEDISSTGSRIGLRVIWQYVDDAGNSEVVETLLDYIGTTAPEDINAAPIINAVAPVALVEGNYGADGQSVVTVTYEDTDTNANNAIAFSFVADNGAASTEMNIGTAIFRIDASTGEITVTGSLDYETLAADARSFDLRVRATDTGNQNASDPVVITINLADGDDGATTFMLSGYTGTPEVGDTLTIAPDVRDPNGDSTLLAADGYTYTWYRTDGTTETDITPTTPTTYKITAADEGFTIGVRITEYVDDAGHTNTVPNIETSADVIASTNVAPVIDTPNLTKSLAEGSYTNEPIADVDATDADGDTLTYSLDEASLDAGFAIDESSGAITFTGILDLEALPDSTDPTITLTVSVSDGTALAVTTNVVLTITDATTNIGSPAFGIRGYDGSVPRVGDVLAVDRVTPDPDGGPSTEYTYQWYRTDGTTPVDIDAAEGATYRLTDDDIGYTVGVLIHAHDDAEGNREAEQTVETFSTVAPERTAAVIEIHAPNLLQDINALEVGNLLGVNVVELDPQFTTVDNRGSTYTWYRIVDGVQGTTPIHQVTGDGPGDDQYTVTADDIMNHASSTHAAGARVDILVFWRYTDNAGNEHFVEARLNYAGIQAPADINADPVVHALAPIDFEEGTYAGGTDPDSRITTLAHSDAENDSVKFRFVDANGALQSSITFGDATFSISDAGVISVAGELDYESATKSYTLMARAVDEANKNFSDFITVTINLTDNTSEGPAVFSLDGGDAPAVDDTLTIMQDTPDPEGDPAGGFTYTWYRTDGTDETILTASNTEGTQYEVVEADLGSTIGVRVSAYTDLKGNNEAQIEVTTATTVVPAQNSSVISIISATPFADLDVGNEVQLHIATQDPQGVTNTLSNDEGTISWYRIVDGVQETTPLQSSNDIADKYTLVADDISTNTKRVDLLLIWTYTDDAGNKEFVEARLDHVGVTPPDPTTANAAPVVNAVVPIDFDEGTYAGGTDPDSQITTLTYSDAESDSVKFRFVDAQGALQTSITFGDATFSISDAGVISVAGELDYESATQSYTLRARAVDETNFNASKFVTVTINLTDNTNEGDAVFTLTSGGDVNVPRVDDVLTVEHTDDPDGNPADGFEYQWYNDDGDIADATSASYRIQAADLGDTIGVRVSDYTDANTNAGSGADLTTAAVVVASDARVGLGAGFVANNAGDLVRDIDVDTTTGQIVLATYTDTPNAPTELKITFTDEAGDAGELIIVDANNPGTNTNAPAHWDNFNVVYNDLNHIVLTFDGGVVTFDSDANGILTSDGVIQDFAIVATYGADDTESVAFSLRLFGDDDPIDATNPLVDDAGAAINVPITVTETDLESGATYTDDKGTPADTADDEEISVGVRSGTMYINDPDVGDSYEVQVGYTYTAPDSTTTTVDGAGRLALVEGETKTLDTEMGMIEVTLNGKQIDWTYTYDQDAGHNAGDGTMPNEVFEFTITDASDSADTQTATPLSFTLTAASEAVVISDINGNVIASDGALTGTAYTGRADGAIVARALVDNSQGDPSAVIAGVALSGDDADLFNVNIAMDGTDPLLVEIGGISYYMVEITWAGAGRDENTDGAIDDTYEFNLAVTNSETPADTQTVAVQLTEAAGTGTIDFAVATGTTAIVPEGSYPAAEPVAITGTEAGDFMLEVTHPDATEHAGLGLTYAFVTDEAGTTTDITHQGFTIDADTGAITYNGTEDLDFDITQSFSLTVRVADSNGLTADVAFDVGVNDVPVFDTQNIFPIVPGTYATASAAEFTIRTSDGNNGDTLAISAVGTLPTGFALADNSDGTATLSFTGGAVTDATADVDIEIQVSDGNGGVSTQTIDVRYIDTLDAFTATLTGTPAGLTEGVDHSGGVEILAAGSFNVQGAAVLGVVTYALVGAPSEFSIDSGTGAITYTGTADYETNQSFALTVQVTDVLGGGRTHDVTVNVAVEDINDNAPTFAETSYDRSIDEVADVTASDATHGTITISADGRGWSYVLNAELVADTSVTETITFTVDGMPRTDTLDLVITRLAGGDYTYSIDGGDAVNFGADHNVAVTGDTGASNVGAPVVADDPDSVGTVTYSITAGDPDDLFEVDANGQISLKSGSVLDFETTQSYTLTLTADDGNSNTDTATVTINVGDTNDNAPTLTISGTGALQATTASVGVTDTGYTFTVSDADTTANINPDVTEDTFSVDDARFDVVAGDSMGEWKLVLLANQAVTHDPQADTIVVTVAVDDGAGNMRKYDFDITTSAAATPDTGDASFVIESVDGHTAPRVNEELRVAIDMQDPDGGVDTTTLSYAWYADGNDTNVLSSVATFTPTAAGSYYARVKYQDGAGNPEATFNTPAITVAAANQVPTISPTLAGTIEEGVHGMDLPGRVAVTFDSADADSDDLSYSFLVNGGAVQTTDDGFTITNDGAITFIGTLDAEGDTTSYDLMVQVSDGRGGTAQSVVTVSVTDVNEAPEFTGQASDYNLEIGERETLAEFSETVIVTDPEDDSLTYVFVLQDTTEAQTDQGFTINRDTGEITIAEADRAGFPARADQTYTLQVRVSDGALTNTREVTVRVAALAQDPVIEIIGRHKDDTTDDNLLDLVPDWVLSVNVVAEDPDGFKTGATPTYKWFHADNEAVAISTEATYTTTTADIGKQIGVSYTHEDNAGNLSPVEFILGDVVRADHTVADADEDNVIDLSAETNPTHVDAGNGADSVTDGQGDDVVIGGRGDDDIDLGSGPADTADSDSDVVVYGIGDQTAQDGGDDITNFEWGKDRFIFSLESDTETDALTDLASFINYITAGTPNDLADDQFRVTFALDFPEDISATTAEVKGIYLHFSDSVFYGGGRISMPILEIEFSENLPDATIIDKVFGGDVSAGIDSASGLVKLEYLNALLGGDDDFEAIGYQIIDIS